MTAAAFTVMHVTGSVVVMLDIIAVVLDQLVPLGLPEPAERQARLEPGAQQEPMAWLAQSAQPAPLEQMEP